jgi:hypothetical protein
MKRLSGLVIALTLLLAVATYSTENEYEDVIHLKDGSVYRGTIVDEIPGETYRIEIYGGSVFVFEADEIDYISRGLAEEVTSPAGTGEETVVEIRRLFFGFRALVGSIYISDEALIPFGGLFYSDGGPTPYIHHPWRSDIFGRNRRTANTIPLKLTTSSLFISITGLRTSAAVR